MSIAAAVPRPQDPRPDRRTARIVAVVAAGATVAALAAPSGADAAVAANSPRTNALDLLGAPIGFSDVDTRVGQVLPTASQRSAVTALGANVRWNRFGTPQTLIRYGGYLGSGFSGDPTTVATSWLKQNASLFRQTAASVSAMAVRVNPMAGKQSNAVSFTQTWNGVPAVQDGVITLGVVGDKVAIATSSSVGVQSAPAPSTLGAQAAWVRAANNVGRVITLGQLSAPKVTASGWTTFTAPGFAQLQYVRPVVVPTPTSGVRAGYEALVVDVQGGRASAYSSVVDGRTGAVLMRYNRVDQSEEQNAVNAAFTATECGAPVAAGTVDAATKQIIVTMTATVPTNDIIVRLLFGATTVASEDTGLGTEALIYAPSGGVPAGDYFVQICPFLTSAVPFVPPFTAQGAFIASNSTTPAAAIPYPPKWDYFRNSPPLTYASTDTRITGCWVTTVNGNPVADCDRKEANLAARAPWDVDVQSGLPTFTTSGNNATTAEAWLSPLTPGGAQRPVKADRNYSDTWTNGWNTTKCNPTSINPGVGASTDILAAVTNLFVGHNRFHDFSYFLGFTEENYNAQVNQFGNVGAGTSALTPDPEVGNVQAGALTGGFPTFEGRDNANQIALPDGVPSITNQYLFQPIAGAFYAPCSDGDMDTSIFGHEYTHLISNRMVGGPMSNLTGAQARSMGESWSDLDALEYMQEFGYTPQEDENPWAVGVYATGNKAKGIRDYALNSNPLNYSDIGFDTTGAEVHADGEIWNAVNYDIRQAMVAKYNAAYPATNKALQLSCAQGERPSNLCPGNRRWIQLVYDAWLLQPASDSMLDARDSYLAADVMRYGGANQTTLWTAFAKRGFGVNASTVDAEDVDPVGGWVAGAGSKASTVNLTVSQADAPGTPKVSGAKVYVGPYEAGVTPIATTSALGAASFRMEPGTYTFTIQKAGLGLSHFQVVVPANGTKNQNVHLTTNLASATNGATITQSANSSDAANLIDDTEDTNWSDEGAAPVNTTTPSVTIHLANADVTPKTIRSIKVSAYGRPGQNRFTQLRQFRVDACVVSNSDPTCSLPTSFTTRYTSPANAFPATLPRPVAPDLAWRQFDVPDFAASYIRFVALNSQCTGNSEYRGEQDNDPTNPTDCVTGSALSPLIGPQGTTVRANEFQAFGFDATTRPPGDPVVPVTVSAPATTTTGSNLTYTVGYTNLGPEDSQHAVLSDVLPAGLSFVSAPGATYTAADRTVRWSLGTVAAGASGSKTLTVKVTALPGSGILNQATFSGDLTLGLPGAAYTLVTG